MHVDQIVILQKLFNSRGFSADETNVIVSMLVFASDCGFWDEHIPGQQQDWEALIKLASN